MTHHHQPRDRNAFQVGIICALPVESDAVEGLFDEFWEEDDIYGKIGHHNVVLAFLPGMGKGSSAGVAASFRSSFGGIKLCLVVGICGGVPRSAEDEEILLGDVIISTGLVQYDFGRRFSNQVVRKDTLQDNLGRSNTEIRAYLAKKRGWRGRSQLRYNASVYLAELCQKEGLEQSKYPGAAEDKLYEATYRHKHHDVMTCTICACCEKNEDPVCNVALESSCVELGCNDVQQVTRSRLEKAEQTGANESSATCSETAEASNPKIHFGLIASGDLVMKSGFHRDEIAAKEKVIAFEMDGAGVWDNFPTVIIKGVCDYADSHKNKKWQRYAAATAAACMKAFLKEWRIVDQPSQADTDSDRISQARVGSSEDGLGQVQQIQRYSGTFTTGGGNGFYGSILNSGGGPMYL
jgi:nucleoside phosphorylase